MSPLTLKLKLISFALQNKQNNNNKKKKKNNNKKTSAFVSISHSYYFFKNILFLMLDVVPLG